MKDIGSSIEPRTTASANRDAAIAIAHAYYCAHGDRPQPLEQRETGAVGRPAERDSDAELAGPASNGVSDCGIDADRREGKRQEREAAVNCAVSR